MKKSLISTLLILIACHEKTTYVTTPVSVLIPVETLTSTTTPVFGCIISDRIDIHTDHGIACNARWTINSLPLLLEAPDNIQADLAFAADYINSHVGVEIFTLDNKKGGYNIKISESDLGGGAYLGIAEWNVDKFQLNFAKIALWSGLGHTPSNDRQFVAVHELLHTLGFAHDETGCSILKPWFDKNCLTINDEDVRSLKLLYGQSSNLIVIKPSKGQTLTSTIVFNVEGQQFCK
jgi:hypothetical protein